MVLKKIAVIMVLRVLMPPGPLIYVILASRRDAATNSREHKAASRRRDNDIVSDHSASKNAIKNLNWGTYIGESILVPMSLHLRMDVTNVCVCVCNVMCVLGALTLEQRVKRWLATCGFDRGTRAGKLEQPNARRKR